jgi:predicted alpha/beta-hydrolase family hydrolase
VKSPAKRFERELVQGWLHEPNEATGEGLVLTHGAGGDCESPLLKALAVAFAEAGYLVLRCNLPYRQQRPHGPPFPAQAANDREGLKHAVEALRELASGRVLLGGHSYGGRQSTMLAAEYPGLVSALLLLSYPLHPPRKPEQLRIAHFTDLRTPGLFVHGTRDPFGSIQEMRDALRPIPAHTGLVEVDGAGHALSLSAVPVILRETTCFVNALSG